MLINNSYFTEVRDKGIPKMIPMSKEYRTWWAEQIHRCKYGYKVGDTYMVGRLYFHLNFFTIETNIGGEARKRRALPTFRDVDWDLFNTIEKCKGWSGLDENGMPEYKNPVKGLMLITGRDFGKSVVGGSNCSYEYTFFKDNEIVVSAGDMKYINPTMNKIRVGLDNMPGGMDYMGRYYPSPLAHQRVKDTWSTEVRSGYKDNETGTVKGFNSRILIRSYNDNPMSANGLRPSFQLMEEVGAFNNLLESYNASIPCWMTGSQQFAVPMLIGTGGSMEKGSIDARNMFYNPDIHNLISFQDEYDNSGGRIGYFVPAYMGMHQFKDKNGITNKELGIKTLEERREKKKKDKVSYEQELQYYPFTPKEAFLITTGNIFPRALLEDQLSYLTSSKAHEHLGQKGDLRWQPDGSLKWEPSDKLFEVSYPHESGKSHLNGCITIYEHPQPDETGRVPFGLYIAGADTIDQDGSTTDSLGSIMVYKRFWKADKTYDFVCCEFTGRPDNAEDYYEIVRKILTYYNAKCLYENNLKGIFVHFSQKNCLHLLAEQPSILKDITPNSKVQRGYGIHMDKNIKTYLVNRVNTYLRTEYDNGKYNTNKVYSINLLKELLYYNDTANFDRVISFGLALIYKEALHKNIVDDNNDSEKKINFDSFFRKHGLN